MKRYIIKKGKARISFSDIGAAARMNCIRKYELRALVQGSIRMTFCGWSLEYSK